MSNRNDSDLDRVVNILDKAGAIRRKNRSKKQDAIPTDSGDTRPVITLVNGERNRVLKESEDALISAGTVYHNRIGILVRVTRTGPKNQNGVTFSDNALTILQASSGWLTTELDRAAIWRRLHMIDGTPAFSKTDAPSFAARLLSEQVGDWRLPYLSGIVECPTLRRDGSVLERPGYDPSTGLFFDSGGIEFEPVPDKPTKARARDAIDSILDLVKDFPYASKADRSVFLSGVLTVPVRYMLRDSPLHAASAPRPRVGKSYQADLPALIATGRTAPAMTAADSPDEEEKRIISILMSGTPLCLIDNIDEPLRSPRLCSAITQENYRGRLLGGNRLADFPTRLVWFASGNNLRFHDDLNPRSLLCYLCPDTDRPEEREFDRDLKRYTVENRHRLAPAAITVLRAYIVAGSPSQGLTGFGSAPDWSALVRSALVWLGCADPVATQHRLRDNDPVASSLARLLEAWHGVLSSRLATAADVVSAAYADPALSDAIKEIASRDDSKVNLRVFGNYLAAHLDRIENGYRLVSEGKRSGAKLYQVVKISPHQNNSRNSRNSRNPEGQHCNDFSGYPNETHETHETRELRSFVSYSKAGKKNPGENENIATESDGCDEMVF